LSNSFMLRLGLQCAVQLHHPNAHRPRSSRLWTTKKLLENLWLLLGLPVLAE
jgi:hypothetical protein